VDESRLPLGDFIGDDAHVAADVEDRLAGVIYVDREKAIGSILPIAPEALRWL
jgi:hypothetical protein